MRDRGGDVHNLDSVKDHFHSVAQEKRRRFSHFISDRNISNKFYTGSKVIKFGLLYCVSVNYGESRVSA